MNAWEKYKKYISSTGMVQGGDRVILAVSGGPDSMALVHLFWRLRKTMPLDLLIVTMDHGLRKQAKKEVSAVKKAGEQFSIPVIVQKIAVRTYAAKEKISLETAGRILRYETLTAIAEEHGFNKIATGHTASDTAETIIMWLVRGTGAEGLSGIPPTRKITDTIHLVRPMLPLTRQEVMVYVKSLKMPYCIDASNLTLDYTRNKIRHQVIPLLETYNPKLVEHLYNLSVIISRENEFLSAATKKAIKRCAQITSRQILLDLKVFFRYNKAIQLRIFKEILPEKRSQFHIERLWEWVFAQTGNKLVLSRSWEIIKNKKRLVFQRTPK
jgi:tRNA(Ile)-lysidine synthase